MKHVCPRCYSENILPIFPKDELWKCLNCGFTGKPHIIENNIIEFWSDFLTLSKQKRK